ncbi:hypothetical protein [Nocardia wallacei]|uniref:hypothetical protein n=1 Tax=Nocardia wallacei TaxID=480035 RepID=UPI002458D0CC|nr:hypothetical protein [Nocardia wallacei]
MAEIRGETRENGWEREYVERATNQRLDQARVYVNREERAFTEYKSGRIDARCVEQLGKHLELLDRGLYRSGEWVSATPLHRTPREFQELVRGARERGLDFRYITPERRVIEEAKEKGRQQVPGRQLELPGVGEKARQQKARQQEVREREQREREQREREERERESERDRRARVEREAAERVAREMIPPVLLRLQGREEAEAAEAEKVRREREAEDEKARARQRDAAERLARVAREVREAAARGQSREMSGREIADLLEVGRPPPGVEAPYRELPTAGSTRGGREERGRERGLAREPRER